MATARRTGRAELDEHVQGVEAAEIDVGLRDTGRPRAELLAELRRGFSTLPGTNVTIGQPISHRIDHMLSGTRANIAVKIFGDDLLTLRRLGERVRDVMTRVPGAVDVSLEQQMDVPVVRFVLNRPAIARYGLRPNDVAEAVETSFAGAPVGRIFDRATAFDLVVKFDPASQADFERLAALPIDTPNRWPGAHSGACGCSSGTRSQHDAARERATADRDLEQRRGPRSRRRRRRHAHGDRVGGADARRVIAWSTAGNSRASRAPHAGCWCWERAWWRVSSCSLSSRLAGHVTRCSSW